MKQFNFGLFSLIVLTSIVVYIGSTTLYKINKTDFNQIVNSFDGGAK